MLWFLKTTASHAVVFYIRVKNHWQGGASGFLHECKKPQHPHTVVFCIDLRLRSQGREGAATRDAKPHCARGKTNVFMKLESPGPRARSDARGSQTPVRV